MTKRKDKRQIKFCIVCGKRISENSNKRKICGHSCAVKRRYLARHGIRPSYENCSEPPIQAYSLYEINSKARESGLTYGQYVAKMSTKKIIFNQGAKIQNGCSL